MLFTIQKIGNHVTDLSRHAAALLERHPIGGDERSAKVLFIDGDHSYDAVKADFSQYGPLVRGGGLIAFHDIVPDFRTRFGTPTDSDTGEVPRFWAEVTQRYKTTEIIESVQQDGYGIGIVHM